MEKRYAQFHIDNDLIRDHPEVVLKIMDGMIVLRAEDLFAMKAIEYTVWHRYFTVVEPGQTAPLLTLHIKYLPDGQPVAAYFMENPKSIIHSKGLM